MTIGPMIATHPDVKGSLNETLARCIEECASCAAVCTSCADACLAEDMVADLRQCIRQCLDCADVCAMAGTLGIRRTGTHEGLIRQAMELCALACQECAEECARHAGAHEHCRLCADHCRRCETLCRDAAASIQV